MGERETFSSRFRSRTARRNMRSTKKKMPPMTSRAVRNHGYTSTTNRIVMLMVSMFWRSCSMLPTNRPSAALSNQIKSNQYITDWNQINALLSSRSREKRLRIRPMGVDSKYLVGQLNTLVNNRLCSKLDARKAAFFF